MADLTDASIPRLAPGCRWGGTPEAPVVLFPEGAIKVEGTGRVILELCTGQFSLGQIIQRLEQQFILAPKDKIRADVISFLERLHAKRIVDYQNAEKQNCHPERGEGSTNLADECTDPSPRSG